MAKSEKFKQFNDLLLEGHKLSILHAIEKSIRTGTALVVEKNGKIVEIKPKYKYVLVPITSAKKKIQKMKVQKPRMKKQEIIVN